MINIPENVLCFIKSEYFDSCEILNDRQKFVLKEILLKNKNYTNVSLSINVVPEQVCNILKKSIKFLENFLKERKSDMLISETFFSVRIKNSLENTNFKYVKDLNGVNFRELLSFRNIGRECIYEIQIYLEEMGMSLNFDELPIQDKFYALKKPLKDLSNIELCKVISFCSDLLKSSLIEEKSNAK